MNTGVVVAIIVAAVVIVIAIVVWAIVRSRQRAQLRDRFGPEYERAVGDADNRKERRAVEADLTDRAERRDQLDIRDLSDEARSRYSQGWQQVQAQFVDQPGAAVQAADALVGNVMRDRGYPVEGFEDQADLISVDHPDLVQNYRTAHDIAERNGLNEAGTEDLRKAFLHYRSLFEELLGDRVTTTGDR
jgi:hypothetical protein